MLDILPDDNTRATADGDGQDVVVTGSRISRMTIDSPAPVQVLTADQIKLSGQTQIADVLNQLPILALTQTNQMT